jgi:hypothetical protein
VLVTDQGITTGKSGVVSDLKVNLTLRDYSSQDVKVTELGRDTALLIYIFKQKGLQGGKEFSTQDSLFAVYVNRGGKWLCAFTQFTPIKQGLIFQVSRSQAR